MQNEDKAIYNAIQFLFKLNQKYTELSYADKTYAFLVEKSYGYIRLYLYKVTPVGI